MSALDRQVSGSLLCQVEVTEREASSLEKEQLFPVEVLRCFEISRWNWEGNL